MKKSILLIACSMIKDEMTLAMKNTDITYDTIWMSSDLHINPDYLRNALQEEINNHQDYEMILLAYGNCGKGLVGLISANTKLAFLRSEDCIHMLLHKKKGLKALRGETYFITKGWMEGKKSLKEEYHYAINKYGPKRAEMIMEIMFKNYGSLMMIDDGSYDLENWIHCARHLSQVLKLDFVITNGDVELLEMFLSLKWDHQVVLISPGTEITKDDFGVQCAVTGTQNVF
ncbi:DUF1638 domain-containing protein [Acetobacterium tundrae]|uniref:DUF1638 domain-containing protein n=1 Tax=Acetobacterium tundrae TaxID=132932 RepID=A0ABR6WM40_9FIRM|nr:DUF1638 domain-containing protein [Acetobacterium tundrae]MBC3797582.1 DUF1638 domain-containing protein [Acetobacterium tundrae]